MKQTKYFCDIKECENETMEEKKHMQVIFTTDQTEGRSRDPYLSLEEFHICDPCLKKVIKSGKYIVGSGAQGYNTYVLGDSK